jgi:amino-acid N-acetyltransferase
MLESELYFIKNLRQASPYISQHRGKTIVFYLPSKIIDDSDNLLQFAKDIVLLKNLGSKIVIALGATLQINRELEKNNIAWKYHKNIRITSLKQIKIIQKTVGLVRSKLEAVFSQACAEQHLPLSLVSANWVIAKPKGVIDGVDFEYTGTLRQINLQAINETLNTGQICLLTPLAYSSFGEVFNLNTLEQAYAVGKKLASNKLMIFTEQKNLAKLPKSLNINELKDNITQENTAELNNILQQSLTISNSIKRIHLMDQDNPSSMLLELFTCKGDGVLIYTDRYHQLRPATQDDITGIINLIKPLEKQGVLIVRDEKNIKKDLKNFIVAEIDGQIIGCTAIYSITPKVAEIACLVVESSHQGDEIGIQLLDKIEQQAKLLNHNEVFILTTQTNHWFKEQGFHNVDVSYLPEQKLISYNKTRKPKILIKKL